MLTLHFYDRFVHDSPAGVFFAHFNVVFQPDMMSHDQRMPTAPTSYITTAEVKIQRIR